MAGRDKTHAALRRLVRLTALGLALAAIGVLWWVRARPAELYRDAERLWQADPVKADALLERSVELSAGDFPAAQLLRSRVLGSLGRWPEALGCFSLIERPAACDQQGLLDLAVQAEAAGQHMLATLALEAANRPGSKQTDVLKALLMLERNGAALEKLLAHCHELQTVAPGEPLGWQIEIAAHQSRKELRPAIDACRRALDAPLDDQTIREVRDDLAGMLMEVGELPSARDELDRLLTEDADEPALLLKHADLLRMEGKPDKALNIVEKVLRQAPSVAARMLRGVLYLDAGRYREAADDLDQVVADDPLNKEAHYKLSQACFKLGEAERAKRHLRESQRLTRQAIDALDARRAGP